MIRRCCARAVNSVYRGAAVLQLGGLLFCCCRQHGRLAVKAAGPKEVSSTLAAFCCTRRGPGGQQLLQSMGRWRSNKNPTQRGCALAAGHTEG